MFEWTSKTIFQSHQESSRAFHLHSLSISYAKRPWWKAGLALLLELILLDSANLGQSLTNFNLPLCHHVLLILSAKIWDCRRSATCKWQVMQLLPCSHVLLRLSNNQLCSPRSHHWVSPESFGVHSDNAWQVAGPRTKYCISRAPVSLFSGHSRFTKSVWSYSYSLDW